MKLKTLALGMALALAAVAPADAQRRGGGGGGGDGRNGNWELLGESRVNLGGDRDVIRLNHDEGYYRNKAYRSLRFVAEGGEVRMKTVRLVYLNGYAEDVDFSRTLRPGEEVDLDLRGERSYLRAIDMNYSGKLGLSLGGGGIRVNQAVIRVFGENVRGRPEAPPVMGRPGGGRFDRDDGDRPGHGGRYRPSNQAWQLLGQQAVGRRGATDVIRVEQSGDFYRDRGLEALHFVSENADVHLMSIRVVYQNGYRENIRVDRLIRAGSEISIDLPGRRSFLREIEVTQRKLPGQRGRAIVSVYGEPTSRRR